MLQAINSSKCRAIIFLLADHYCFFCPELNATLDHNLKGRFGIIYQLNNSIDLRVIQQLIPVGCKQMGGK